MKKLTSILLVLTMLLTLMTGCGSAQPEETIPADYDVVPT